jgi:hypothetical protein
MHLSLSMVAMTLLCGQTPEPCYQSANFVVYAPTSETAELVGVSAESWRKKLAKLWLGSETADWSSPCQINVTLSMDTLDGVSEVSFAGCCVTTQKMSIKGPLDRIVTGPLPHELTHILFAHYFGVQPPRWADEGGAMLSEGERQAARQSKCFRKILGEEKQFALRRLLEMQKYPADVTCLYAQSHSVTRFLINAKGNQAFLAFVRDGVDRDWDDAIRDAYGYKDVEHLEKAWLGWVASQPDLGNRPLVVGRRTQAAAAPAIRSE